MTITDLFLNSNIGRWSWEVSNETDLSRFRFEMWKNENWVDKNSATSLSKDKNEF